MADKRPSTHVRPAVRDDVEALAGLRAALWPKTPLDVHLSEVAALVAGRPRSTLPLVAFVAEVGAPRSLAGFVEVGLRSHADGCDPIRPAGFVEGWYVVPSQQRQGVGRALIEAAEDWCRSQGCREIASDTWSDAEVSQRAHEALGFEVRERGVNYRKGL